MTFTFEHLEFNKDENGVCTASATINGREYSFQQTSQTERQSYYMASNVKLTPEVQAAFHCAGLFFKDAYPQANFVFMVPDQNCTPELWVDNKAYYDASQTVNHDDFESALTGCLRAIDHYKEDKGENLRTTSELPSALRCA